MASKDDSKGMNNQAQANEKLPALLVSAFGADITEASINHGIPVFTVHRNAYRKVVEFLFNLEEMPFRFLTDITGIHLPDNKEDLGVICHLHCLTSNVRLRIKTFVTTSDSHVDSLTPLFPGANWMERETFDFYGIHFKGHPNLTRILNMDDMLIHPLRKEYPLEDQSRKDKNDAMFGR